MGAETIGWKTLAKGVDDGGTWTNGRFSILLWLQKQHMTICFRRTNNLVKKVSIGVLLKKIGRFKTGCRQKNSQNRVPRERVFIFIDRYVQRTIKFVL